MKGLHLSDVHYDLSALNAVKDYSLKRDDLEFIAITGDFLNRYLTVFEAEQMQHSVQFIAERIKPEEQAPFQAILQHILNSSDIPKDIRQAAEKYIGLTGKFRENAEKQYYNLINIIQEFPQNVLTVPGNWDSIDYFKFFEPFDLHKKSTTISNIKFAGYGGADRGLNIIPSIAAIGFSEKKLDQFLCEEDPDIALTHVPAVGIQDLIQDDINFGCWSVLAYARAQNPTTVLYGHAHESRGIGKDPFTRTIFENAGNLGFYEGSPRKGTFYEIDADEKGVNYSIPYKVISGQVIEDKEADSVNGELSKNKTEEAEEKINNL